jgi:thiol-disulfide isomerase/thioredoxin
MKLKFFLFFFNFVVKFILCQLKIEEMTDKNYIKIFKENEAVLVYFYAEDSKRCKEMNEEIAKLHEHINENNLEVKLVKVDVTKEDNVAVEFGVESIPKLKFIRFRYKIKNEYEGKPTFEEIRDFLFK